MAILIISKKEGFRRAGIKHSETPSVYEDDFFTPEQLDQLKSEPMLIVQHIDGEPEGVDALPWDNMTVSELKHYAANHQIDLGAAAKRDDILAAIAAAELVGPAPKIEEPAAPAAEPEPEPEKPKKGTKKGE